MLTSLNKKDSINRLLDQASNPPQGNDPAIISYLFTKQASLINPEDPELVRRLANCLFKLKFYAHALKSVEKWFTCNQKDNDAHVRATMFYMKGTCLFHLRKYDVASEYLKKAINGFAQTKDNEMVIEAKRILEDELPKAKENLNGKPASQKREECIFIKKNLELNELPDVPGKMVYLLPADWLEKWKKYNNYYEFMGDENKKTEFMEEEAEKVESLGPIDISNILVPDTEPYLIDPSFEELYANLPIKLGLEENRDFFIVNEEVWNFLYQRYGGIPVPRPTYRQTETSMGISVETWLQKINIILLPIPKSEQPSVLKAETIYISKRKTVKDLIEKMIEVYSVFFPNYKFRKNENRIWKVDPRFELGFAWKRWEGESSFELHGSVLDKNLSIEEAEISSEDTLIFETHFLSKNWFLFEDEVKQKSAETSSYMTLSNIKDFPSGSKKGLTGLQNLGNTCFMNSAIQCLSNTFDLTGFFLTDEYKKDINKFNPLGSGGKLAYYYSQLMKEVWLGNSSYVSPWDLKKTIGKLASQFVGYGQQDSQELLSYLLDGLHEDLNRVKEKPFIETKDDDNRPDEIVAVESWNNHLKRNQSKIQELMHGQFKSILDCPDCKKVSITFDPYMMISLPIPTVEYTKFFLYFVFNTYERIPIKITFNMPSNTTYPEILTKLSKVTKVNKKNIVMGLLKEHKLVEFAGPSIDALYLKDHPGILFAYEIPSASFGNITDGATNGMTDSSIMNGSSDSSTTASSTKMETESDTNTPSSLKDSLIRVYIQAEPKAFYESEKTISYTRLIRFEPSDTYKDLHLKIYERMRVHLDKYFTKQGLKSPIKLEDRSKAAIDKEYIKLFPDDNEGQWMYKLFMVNTAKEDPKTGKKPPCDICQKTKCARCILPNDEGRVINYMEKMKIQPRDIVIELKIASKTIKLDNLPLNQCIEYKGDENDETNPNRNYNIYDCINLFTRREKLEKDNAWYCSKCKAHKEALKKMEIYKVPPVLILHLKRFKTQKASSIGPFYWGQGKKINVTIDFPINGLDLREYVLGPDRENAIYDLYAVSNHYGGLSGGHYTAFAKNPLTGQWYDFNDSRVSPASEKEIVAGAAYTLFYKKREQGSGN